MYRGHLGREIVRWLLIEIQSDRSKPESECYFLEQATVPNHFGIVDGPFLYPHGVFNDRSTLFEKLKSSISDGGIIYTLQPITCTKLFIANTLNPSFFHSINQPSIFEDKAKKGPQVALSFRTDPTPSLTTLSLSGGCITINVMEARMLRNRAAGKPPSPYCSVSLHQSRRGQLAAATSGATLSHMKAMHVLAPQHRTATVDGSTDPVWADAVTLHSAYASSPMQDAMGAQQERSRLQPLLLRPLSLLVTCHDEGCTRTDNFLGQVLLSDWKPGARLERWCPLYTRCGKLQINHMGNISAVKIRLADDRSTSPLLAQVTAASERIQARVRSRLARRDYADALRHLASEDGTAGSARDSERGGRQDLSARLCLGSLQRLRAVRAASESQRVSRVMHHVGGCLVDRSGMALSDADVGRLAAQALARLDEAEALSALGLDLLNDGHAGLARKYLGRALQHLRLLDAGARRTKRYWAVLTRIVLSDCVDDADMELLVADAIESDSEGRLPGPGPPRSLESRSAAGGASGGGFQVSGHWHLHRDETGAPSPSPPARPIRESRPGPGCTALVWGRSGQPEQGGTVTSTPTPSQPAHAWQPRPAVTATVEAAGHRQVGAPRLGRRFGLGSGGGGPGFGGQVPTVAPSPCQSSSRSADAVWPALTPYRNPSLQVTSESPAADAAGSEYLKHAARAVIMMDSESLGPPHPNSSMKSHVQWLTDSAPSSASGRATPPSEWPGQPEYTAGGPGPGGFRVKLPTRSEPTFAQASGGDRGEEAARLAQALGGSESDQPAGSHGPGRRRGGARDAKLPVERLIEACRDFGRPRVIRTPLTPRRSTPMPAAGDSEAGGPEPGRLRSAGWSGQRGADDSDPAPGPDNAWETRSADGEAAAQREAHGTRNTAESVAVTRNTAEGRAVRRADQLQRLQRLSASLGYAGGGGAGAAAPASGSEGRLSRKAPAGGERRTLSPPPVWVEGRGARTRWDLADGGRRGETGRIREAGSRHDRLSFLEASLQLMDRERI